MRGGKLVRVAFVAVITVGIAKLVRVLRGPKAPQFSQHPSVDGGPATISDAPPGAPERVPDASAPPSIADATPGAGQDQVVAEFVSPPAPDGVLADPRRELAGELAAPEPTPEPEAPPTVESLPAEAGSADTAEPHWRAPLDGACPDGYPLKAKLRSGIYHQPGSSAYDRTQPDRCYATTAEAEADGLRPPKR